MTVLILQVAANTDDGQEQGDTTWLVDGQDSDGNRVGDVAGVSYDMGMRFTGATIPAGATINSAVVRVYMTFKAGGATGIKTVLRGFAADDTPAFSTTDRPSQRSKTTASVVREYVDGEFSANSYLSLNDCSAIIQELVDRAGWGEDAIGLVLENNASNIGLRWQFQDYGRSAPNAADITIDYTPAAAGPAITSITDPVVTGGGYVIGGTDFGAVQGSGGVTQEQGAVVVALTESAWADTAITATSATIESTGLKYGVQTIRVTDGAAADDTTTSTQNPVAGNSYVDLTSVATVGQIITVAALAIGDQLRYENVTTPGSYAVVVLADGTFTIDGSAPDGVYTFEVRAWDTSDQTWGTAADQTVTVGTPATGDATNTRIFIGIGIGI